MNVTDLLGRMSSRERFMLSILIIVGLLIWASHLWRLHDALSTVRTETESEWEQQEAWLRNALQIEQDLEAEMERIDTAATLDSAGLVAAMDELARARELAYELGTPATSEEDLFRWHTLRVGVRNARLPDLILLDRSLRGRYPYLALEEFTITANRADPRLLGARLTVSAYQSRFATPRPPPATPPTVPEPEPENLTNTEDTP